MNPSLRSLAVIEDMLTGHLRGIFGSFHAGPMPFHFVPPVGVEDVLAGRLHDVLPIILAVATIRSPRTADFPETIHRPLAAFASMTSPGSSTLLLPLRVHGSACAGLKKGSARAAVDVTRTIPRGRHDPFTSPSGGRRGPAQGASAEPSTGR